MTGQDLVERIARRREDLAQKLAELRELRTWWFSLPPPDAATEGDAVIVRALANGERRLQALLAEAQADHATAVRLVARWGGAA